MAQGSAAVCPGLHVGVGESVLDSADHSHCEGAKGARHMHQLPLCPCTVSNAAAHGPACPPLGSLSLVSCRWTTWLPAKWTHPSTPPAGTAWCKVGCSVIALESGRPPLLCWVGHAEPCGASWQPGQPWHPSAPCFTCGFPPSLPCNAMQSNAAFPSADYFLDELEATAVEARRLAYPRMASALRRGTTGEQPQRRRSRRRQHGL